MGKTKISERIHNAWRALRGDPWPVILEGPKIEYRRTSLETFHASFVVPLEVLDLSGPENVTESTKRVLVHRLAEQLIDSAAVDVQRLPDFRAGSMCYKATLQAVLWEV